MSSAFSSTSMQSLVNTTPLKFVVAQDNKTVQCTKDFRSVLLRASFFSSMGSVGRHVVCWLI